MQNNNNVDAQKIAKPVLHRRCKAQNWSAVEGTDRLSSVFCCCGPVDQEFTTWQSSWPSTESQHV